MTELEWRLHAIGQMAATLDAGDRAGARVIRDPKFYASRAIALFDAVDSEMAASGTFGASQREESEPDQGRDPSV